VEDDSGELFEPGIAIGMRKLTIIDVAGGHQSIANEDQTAWAIQNGDIYKLKKLTERLGRRPRLARAQGAGTLCSVHGRCLR
jgi:asparagine synthase (glutamine-hydrolysing)